MENLKKFIENYKKMDENFVRVEEMSKEINESIRILSRYLRGEYCKVGDEIYLMIYNILDSLENKEIIKLTNGKFFRGHWYNIYLYDPFEGDCEDKNYRLDKPYDMVAFDLVEDDGIDVGDLGHAKLRILLDDIIKFLKIDID